MNHADTPACGTCRFWQALNPEGEGYAADRNYHVDDDGEGICRRLPPIGQRRDYPGLSRSEPYEPNHAVDAALWAQWPVTSRDLDWCGEHAPRTGA